MNSKASSKEQAAQFSPELLAKAAEFLRAEAAEAKLNEDEGWEAVGGNMSEAAKRARPADVNAQNTGGVAGSSANPLQPAAATAAAPAATPAAPVFTSRRSTLPAAPAVPVPWSFKLDMIPEPELGQVTFPEGISSMRMWAATEIAFGKHIGKGYGELGVSPVEEQISYARWCRSHSTGAKAKAEFRDLGKFLRALYDLQENVDQSAVKFPESQHTRTFKRY